MTKNPAAVALLACAMLARPSAASEITVLSAGAVQPGLMSAVAGFEKRTGHRVKISFDTATEIRTRVGAGEVFDVVIAPPAALDAFVASGKVDKVRVLLGRVGMGVAVRPGAPIPDISSAEALRRSVMAADSLLFSLGSSGVYFEALLKKMGIYEQVEGKITRFARGAMVFEHVLKGSGNDLSFGQLTEIRQEAHKGLRLVGPFPPEVQNYTSYAAVAMVASRAADVARDFVRHLGSPGAKALFVAAGIE